MGCCMPKLVTRPPKYTLHKGSGQAIVKINGKVHYLGPWQSAESKVRYQEAVSSWAAQQVRAANAPTLVADLPHTADTTVVELIVAYLEHAKPWYTKNGEPTGSLAAVRPVLRLLREMSGSVPVSKFKPSHLDAFQRRMIANGASRNYINGCCTKIKTMFKWGVARDLAPVTTWQALLAVRRLAKGRTKARETDPILPVDDWVVDGTLRQHQGGRVRRGQKPQAKPGLTGASSKRKAWHFRLVACLKIRSQHPHPSAVMSCRRKQLRLSCAADVPAIPGGGPLARRSAHLPPVPA